MSTLIAQAAASYLFDLINKQTRILFAWKTESILLFIPLTVKYAARAMRGHDSSKRLTRDNRNGPMKYLNYIVRRLLFGNKQGGFRQLPIVLKASRLETA